jgi:hypothetical protein
MHTRSYTRAVPLSRLWLAAAFVVAVWVAPLAPAKPRALAPKQSPTIAVIERNLANALANTKSTQLLRFRRYRGIGGRALADYQVYWIDLGTGQRRALDYNASGNLVTGRSYSYSTAPSAGWNPSGACGCDLDPFTDFPGRALHVSLLGGQTIDGQPTFHLRFTATGGSKLLTTDFWIDRSTHLPVRSRVVYREANGNGQLGPTMSTTDEFTWLPRTSANLAHLKA